MKAGWLALGLLMLTVRAEAGTIRYNLRNFTQVRAIAFTANGSAWVAAAPGGSSASTRTEAGRPFSPSTLVGC
jgi:hypothetical protein